MAWQGTYDGIKRFEDMAQQHHELGREGKLAERRALRKRITALLHSFYKIFLDKGVPERFSGLVNRVREQTPEDRPSVPPRFRSS